MTTTTTAASDDDPVQFLASFPTIQSAIKVDGAGGARVQLDIPETELPAIARLLLLRGVVLRVTVEIEENRTHGKDPGKAQNQSRAARRPTDVARG